MKIAVLNADSQQSGNYVEKIEKEFLQQIYTVEINSFSNITDMCCNCMDYDILFTDIEMPEKDGITFAKELRERMENLIIVFFSDYDYYVWDSFSVGAIYFIRKRYFDQEIKSAVKRCLDIYGKQHQSIVLKCGNEMVQYAPADIIYVEASGKNVVVCCTLGRKEIKLAFTEAEKKLIPFRFIKIHRSYLVNYRFIKRLYSKNVELANGECLPISKYRLAEVKSLYKQYVE